MLKDVDFAIATAGTPKRQKVWRHTFAKPQIVVAKNASLTAADEVLALGSCFANEIRWVLESAGVAVHPKIDPAIAPLFIDEAKAAPRWGAWDERVHYQCFTPFSIRQEFDRALGSWQPSDEAIFEGRLKGVRVFADPYRRAVYSHSRAGLLEIRRRMDAQVARGIDAAQVIVLTLGLVETFRLRDWGGYIAEMNPLFDESRLEFVNATRSEILAELRATMELLRSRYPSKQVVLTVSPIPIARTFSGCDAITATMRAKSILRACVDDIVAQYPHTCYWPSYEFAMWSDSAFDPSDGRHIRPEAVEKIVAAFCRSFFNDSVAAAIAAGKAVRQAVTSDDHAAFGLPFCFVNWFRKAA